MEDKNRLITNANYKINMLEAFEYIISIPEDEKEFYKYIDEKFGISINTDHIRIKILTYKKYIELNKLRKVNHTEIRPKKTHLPFETADNLKKYFKPKDIIKTNKLDNHSKNLVPLIGNEKFIFRFAMKYPTPLLLGLTEIAWNKVLFEEYMNSRFGYNPTKTQTYNFLAMLKTYMIDYLNIDLSNDNDTNERNIIDYYCKNLISKKVLESIKSNTQIHLCLSVLHSYKKNNRTINKHAMLLYPLVEDTEFIYYKRPAIKYSFSANFCLDENVLFERITDNGIVLIYTDYNTDLTFNNFLLESWKDNKILNNDFFAIPTRKLLEFENTEVLTLHDEVDFKDLDPKNNTLILNDIFYFFTALINTYADYLYTPNISSLTINENSDSKSMRNSYTIDKISYDLYKESGITYQERKLYMQTMVIYYTNEQLEYLKKNRKKYNLPYDYLIMLNELYISFNPNPNRPITYNFDENKLTYFIHIIYFQKISDIYLLNEIKLIYLDYILTQKNIMYSLNLHDKFFISIISDFIL